MSDQRQRPPGPPAWVGIRPGKGVAPELGRPKGSGKLPGAGVARGAGRLPEDEGVKLPGTPGQVMRGTPGQLDPWADNPWELGDPGEGGWAPGAVDDDLESDLYVQHPNLFGADEPGGEGSGS